MCFLHALVPWVLLMVQAPKIAIALEWTSASRFPCPALANATCSQAEAKGFGPSSQHGDIDAAFQLRGFKFAGDFESFKKDGEYPRSTGSSFGRYYRADVSEQPSLSLRSNRPFSIDELYLSATPAVEVDCIYAMADGTICRESHTCQSKLSVYKNKQCGGKRISATLIWLCPRASG